MTVIFGFLSGFLASSLFLPFFFTLGQTFTVNNYRGQPILTATGIWLALSFVLGSLPLLIWSRDLIFFWFFLLSITFIGFLDDIILEKAKGLKGHLLKLKTGQLTPGILKLVFIFIFSVGVAFFFKRRYWLIDGLLLSLLANTVNTLDTRPLRAISFYLVSLLIGTINNFQSLITTLAWVLAGGSLAIYPFERKEATMLGDAGSNLLGAMLGLITWNFTLYTRIALIVLALIWQVLADRYSFSRFLEKIKGR